jgi:hypothetical protein
MQDQEVAEPAEAKNDVQ